ncbi:MAG: DUF6272 family protein [Fluviicola sp.]|jgi:hypothetical protein
MQVGTAHIDFKQLVSDRVKELHEGGYKHVSISHIGGINQDLVNSLSTSVEDLMISAGDKKALIKRVFSIVIEGLQNMLIHGERIDGERLGMLIVVSNEEKYLIEMGNVTFATEKEKLVSYLERLNSLSDEGVKELYMETLNNGLISEKGGAGLGFITMRMKSKNILEYHFTDLGEGKLFFRIGAYLDRQ